MKNGIFKDKTVWIIGASSGIGEALAYGFCREQARVIVSSRNETDLVRVKNNCEGNKENIAVLPLDISVPDQIPEKSKIALDLWGSVDYLILAAGIVARDLVQNIELSIDRKVMETNYFGAVALTKCVLPSMLHNEKGHIVVISSLSGKYGVPRLSAYSASKHALHGFFESLRAELFQKGIKISIIIPGFINTSIIKKAFDGRGIRNEKNLRVNEGGMSAEKCAFKIIKSIAKGKEVALIGGIEIFSVYL